MGKYQVQRKDRSHVFGIYEGDSAELAIEAMYRDAGYASRHDVEDVTGESGAIEAIQVEDSACRIDPAIAGADDCDSRLQDGDVSARDLAASKGMCPDEALINAMGRAWVCKAAGAPDDSSESWEQFGLPWCEKYNAAYQARAETLAAVSLYVIDNGAGDLTVVETSDISAAIRGLYGPGALCDDSIRTWRATDEGWALGTWGPGRAEGIIHEDDVPAAVKAAIEAS
jgi:hypothetical protein